MWSTRVCYFVDIRLVTLTGLLAYFYVYINIYQYTVFMHVYNIWIYINVKYVYIYIHVHTTYITGLFEQ